MLGAWIVHVFIRSLDVRMMNFKALCSHASPPLTCHLLEDDSQTWDNWHHKVDFLVREHICKVLNLDAVGAFLSMSRSSFVITYQIGLSTEPTSYESTTGRWHKPTGAHQTKLGSRSQQNGRCSNCPDIFNSWWKTIFHSETGHARVDPDLQLPGHCGPYSV